METTDKINNLLAMQEQPSLSDDEIKEIERLAEERQQELELEAEIEAYLIEKVLEE